MTKSKRPLPAKHVPLTINVLRLKSSVGLPLPSYQSSGAAGMDLTAALAVGQNVTLAPGDRAMIPTGLAIALPPNTEAQVRPRSGLAAKHGVTVVNSPGTIDADYRGEISVILINLGREAFTVARGDRIAQMIIAPIVQANLIEVATLDQTVRGSGGFGSTGIAERKGAPRSARVGNPELKAKKSKAVAPGTAKTKPRSAKAQKRAPK